MFHHSARAFTFAFVEARDVGPLLSDLSFERLARKRSTTFWDHIYLQATAVALRNKRNEQVDN